MKSRQFTAIDLFSGCGGFSLGLRQAGYKIAAALDFNHEAIQVYRKNFPEVECVRVADLTQFTPEELQRIMGLTYVDLIVGGPPCQGFSTVRQADGANSGPRMVEDPRRNLYKSFLDFVRAFRPKVFVMENVLGIKSAANGYYFTRVQEEARGLGYRVHAQVERAAEFGLPQKRVRQLIIGTKLEMPIFIPSLLSQVNSPSPLRTLGEAIGDLPELEAGEGDEFADYDLKQRADHLSKYGREYLCDIINLENARKLTCHRARPHSQRDLRDFAKLLEGENSAHAMARGVEFEFPYDRTTFKDRYTRQHRDKQCSTIVAHLSKDGLMFIHPTQNRSLTPREAARIQSFPDTFDFPVPRTHQFRVIGNAVPPLLAKAIGIGVKKYFTEAATTTKRKFLASILFPKSFDEAAHRLQTAMRSSNSDLAALEADEFKKLWFAISFLFSNLHPEAALEHGKETSTFSRIENQSLKNLHVPYYVQSGWPVHLSPIAAEARRRFQVGELAEKEFYCSHAVKAGMKTILEKTV